MKTCYFCRGPVEPARIDYMAKHSRGYTLVKDLLVEQCQQCGEVFLDGGASRQVDMALSQTAQCDEHLDIPVVRCS